MDTNPHDLALAAASGIGAYGVWVLKRLALNVEGLNEKMAVVLTRLGAKERTIDDHEDRIRRLEAKRNAAT